MTAHVHSQIIPGCYRCELGRDEARAAAREARTEARALREMAQDFRHVDMIEAAEICDEKAASVEAELRHEAPEVNGVDLYLDILESTYPSARVQAVIDELRAERHGRNTTGAPAPPFSTHDWRDEDMGS